MKKNSKDQIESLAKILATRKIYIIEKCRKELIKNIGNNDCSNMIKRIIEDFMTCFGGYIDQEIRTSRFECLKNEQNYFEIGEYLYSYKGIRNYYSQNMRLLFFSINNCIYIVSCFKEKKESDYNNAKKDARVWYKNNKGKDWFGIGYEEF